MSGAVERTVGAERSETAPQTEVLSQAEICGPPVGPGTEVGRYTLRASIGSGGMGQVFRAHDPHLDREVAIKLLHRAVSSRSIERLRREAMAMAQLSHPNVLPVYDVGSYDGWPFIAMELVRGKTMADWLRGETHSEAELLRVCEAAGRGLLAAHQAGMIHRDFKPGNVLIGDDGRVRVMDFGLARATGDFTQEDPPEDSSVALSADLTQHGAVMGTPAYMAPEQSLAEAVGPAADQYAFCVVLWEALVGRRPTHGITDPLELTRAKVQGPPSTLPPELPRRLHAVLRRGLSPSPADRYGSMDELLAAIRPSGRSPWVRGGIAVAVLGVLGLTAAAGLTNRAGTCADRAQQPLDGWDVEGKEQARQALLSTDVVHAPETWARLEPVLDDYAATWSSSWMDVCRGREAARPDSRALDRQAACLGERRREFRALVATIGRADTTVVTGAVEAARGLTAPDRCSAKGAASELPELSAEQKAEAEAIADRLAALRAEQRAGRILDTLDDARALHARAEALGYAPLTIDTSVALGHVLAAKPDEEAIERFTWAFLEAQASGFDERAADAALALARMEGNKLQHYDEGLRWAGHSRALVERLGDPARQARYHTALGFMHDRAGKYELALAEQQQALRLLQELYGDQGPEVARARTAVGGVLTSLGQYERAQAHIEQGLAELREALGEQHPTVGSRFNTLGHLQRLRGDYDGAQASLERALEIMTGVYGPGHVSSVHIINNLGTVAISRFDYDKAEVYFAEALRLQEEALGSEHPQLVGYLVNLAIVDRRRDRYPQAIAKLHRARDILEAEYGPQHAELGGLYNNLGNLHDDLGDLEKSALCHQRAMAIREQMGDRGELADSLQQLGNVRSQQGQHAEAIEMLERAVQIHRDMRQEQHPEMGDAQDMLGHALRRKGDPEAALVAYERGAEIAAEIYGPDDPRTVERRVMAGLMLVALGREAEVVEPLEQAVARLEADSRVEPDADELAVARYALARARWARDPKGSRALAEQALASFGESPGDAGLVDELRQWLADHPAR